MTEDLVRQALATVKYPGFSRDIVSFGLIRSAGFADGTAKVQGDVTVLAKLASTMVDFDPRFEVLPGTKARPEPAMA